MNRREFIQASFFSSIAFLASCRNALTPPPALEQTADVLVIGAGMAGIAAAQALRQRGLTVTILEARERVGGRVWTDRSWQGTALDLGASWIHGTKKNPLTELVKQFNIKTLPTHYDSHTVYDADGRALNESERDSIDARLRQLQKNASAVRDERQVRGDADISLGQAFEQIRANQNLTRAEQRKLDHAINATIEHEFAADVSDLSLYQFDEDKQFRGDDVLFPDGYDQLVKKLADGLDIRLEQVVTKIELDEAGVNVTTNRGVFQAARVLITLPLGVLKSGAVVFIPALPERKAAAIRRLGMGVLNKVYLRFTAPFWAKEPELLGYIAESKGEWAEFLNIFKYTDAPILLGFNAGTYGAAIEKFADAEIIAQAMRVLRRIYGAAAADPQAALITRWASDPFARGSYSYPTVGTSEDDYAALAEPIDARLFFAGEATNKDYPSTVHGAYLSGIREADRIANLR